MKYFRLMTELPAPAVVPTKPKVPLDEVLAAVRAETESNDRNPDRLLLDALVARIDMANLEAAMSGRTGLFDTRGLLSREEVAALVKDGARSGSPAVTRLPFLEGLVGSDDGQGRGASGASSASDPSSPAGHGHAGLRAAGPEYGPNQIWKAYFEYLCEMGQTYRSAFLTAYAAFEAPLANALAQKRASALGWDTSDLVQTEEPLGADIHDALLSRIAEEPEPMERERLLDTARLSAIDSMSGNDPFGSDALLALVAAALVCDRWDIPEFVNVHELLEVAT